jgi:hypothetical protein
VLDDHRPHPEVEIRDLAVDDAHAGASIEVRSSRIRKRSTLHGTGKLDAKRGTAIVSRRQRASLKAGHET